VANLLISRAAGSPDLGRVMGEILRGRRDAGAVFSLQVCFAFSSGAMAQEAASSRLETTGRSSSQETADGRQGQTAAGMGSFFTAS